MASAPFDELNLVVRRKISRELDNLLHTVIAVAIPIVRQSHKQKLEERIGRSISDETLRCVLSNPLSSSQPSLNATRYI